MTSDVGTDCFDSFERFVPNDIDTNVNDFTQKCKHRSYQNCRSCQSVHRSFKTQVRKDKGLRTSHINVCSLLGKIDEIRLIVLSSDIDIFGISETHLNETIDDSEIKIPGYEIERRDRSTGRGGGVILYIKSSIN